MQHKNTQKLIALSAAFALLMFYPLLSIFNKPTLVGGVPVLYVYLFVLWAVMIAATAYAVRDRKKM